MTASSADSTPSEAQDGPTPANAAVLQAIALRLRLGAVYNRAPVTLAPHILYTRHGELYVDAVTIDRDGKPPREIKIGSFKLSGLQDIAVGDVPFERWSGFDPRDERYAGVTVFSIDPA